MKGRPYLTLAAALSVHFLIMWALTYVGVASLDHVHLNWNRFYMAVVMVAPMVMVMVVAMRHMFPDERTNAVILAVSLLVFIASFAAIRAQTLIDDAQLSRSMIPHHSVAIKTCEEATLRDPDTIQLCQQIIRAQLEEIAQMERILERLDR
jgi:uncharacterized protein (DUF305 family)